MTRRFMGKNEMQDKLEDLIARLEVLLQKLDVDTGVTDTDYEEVVEEVEGQ